MRVLTREGVGHGHIGFEPWVICCSHITMVNYFYMSFCDHVIQTVTLKNVLLKVTWCERQPLSEHVLCSATVSWLCVTYV